MAILVVSMITGAQASVPFFGISFTKPYTHGKATAWTHPKLLGCGGTAFDPQKPTFNLTSGVVHLKTAYANLTTCANASGSAYVITFVGVKNLNFTAPSSGNATVSAEWSGYFGGLNISAHYAPGYRYSIWAFAAVDISVEFADITRSAGYGSGSLVYLHYVDVQNASSKDIKINPGFANYTGIPISAGDKCTITTLVEFTLGVVATTTHPAGETASAHVGNVKQGTLLSVTVT